MAYGHKAACIELDAGSACLSLRHILLLICQDKTRDHISVPQ